MKNKNSTDKALKPKTDDLVEALHKVTSILIDEMDVADRDRDITEENEAIQEAKAVLRKEGIDLDNL